MITTIGKARQTRCVKDIGLHNQHCLANECMAWEFWVPPPGTESEWARIHPPETEDDKKGYCGLTGKH